MDGGGGWNSDDRLSAHVTERAVRYRNSDFNEKLLFSGLGIGVEMFLRGFARIPKEFTCVLRSGSLPCDSPIHHFTITVPSMVSKYLAWAPHVGGRMWKYERITPEMIAKVRFTPR